METLQKIGDAVTVIIFGTMLFYICYMAIFLSPEIAAWIVSY